MTPTPQLKKVEDFKKDFKILLEKYDAEIMLEDFGSGYFRDGKMVVNFNYDYELGIIDDYVLGTYVSKDRL
jgi:hypothetical protein